MKRWGWDLQTRVLSNSEIEKLASSRRIHFTAEEVSAIESAAMSMSLVSELVGEDGAEADLPERESVREIIETLRDVGHRLTTTKLVKVMEKRGLNPAESTVKKRLAELVRTRRLDNDPKAKPRGYGLPEWNGSSGSRGS
jgi:hypothetical protein